MIVLVVLLLIIEIGAPLIGLGYIAWRLIRSFKEAAK